MSAVGHTPPFGFQAIEDRDGPLLTVLVVSYNTRDLTLKALRTFHENTGYPFELIVVDNASGDGSADAIESEFPMARVIPSDQNLGFARPNNEGAKYASGDVLLLLNPDTEVLPDAIGKTMKFRMENPEARIRDGKTLYPDGSLNPSSCWRRQTLWSLLVQAFGLSSLCRRCGLFNPERVLNLDAAGSREVDVVSGCMPGHRMQSLLGSRQSTERAEVWRSV